MIVVYPFSLIDQHLAHKNAVWMNELGGCHGHEVLMIYDQRCDPAIVDQVRTELTQGFDKVHVFVAKAEIDGWPEGANYFFRTAAALLQSRQYPYFFWMEPDAIPLREGWLDAIWAAHVRGKRAFTGDRVQVEGIPLHMSGVGVYPNPLYEYSGEAYRAHEVAWDMAGANQIVPRANFTKLIEHAWKHPQFTNESELQTQIRPEAVLFHSSKDGSLIDLLRKQKNTAAPVLAEPKPETTATKSGGEARKSTNVKPADFSEQDSRGGSVDFTCDIFIRTYPGDYEWLFHYCLPSIAKFCTGFRKIWVISPAPPEEVWTSQLEKWGVTWKILNEEAEDHYLSQQIHKLYADVITDYQADMILHVDSDVIFKHHCNPYRFMHDGKVVWPFTPYSEIQTPWQSIIEKFMGEPVEFEFMRRFPIMIPRWLYPRLREFCHKRHGVIISDYVRMQPLRAFSEFNALGAYAYKFHRDKFTFINTVGWDMPEPVARQFFSWGGITPQVKAELEAIFKGGDIKCDAPVLNHGQEPASPTAQFIQHPSNGASTVPPADAPPKGIKALPNDIWIIEDDTHISKWIELQGRLDHDQNTLPFILPLLNEGDVVVDAGAFIGDHTIAYSKAVGKKGVVHAFEPNPIAYQCMFHNLRGCTNVILHDVGLSSESESVPLSGNNNNYGGCYVGEHMKLADVAMQTLDDWFYQAQIDFIKLDIEGYEAKALRGARKLIERCHPVMVIEVNQVALKRQGSYPGEIFKILNDYGYEWKIMQENCGRTDPMYDIICTVKASPEGAESVPEATDGATVRCLPKASSPVTTSNLKDYVQALVDFAGTSPKAKSLVMQRLVYAGLRPKTKAKKK